MAVYIDSRTSFSDSQNKLISRQTLMSGTALLIYLALIKFLVHLVTGGNYGFFRDELYYIDAGQHLAFGYVEFPPFIALLAALVHSISPGNSLVVYHILPAIAGALLVLLTGLIARELGGGRFAQCLAALASLAAITFLAIDSLFSMDSFDELWWVLMAYILNTADQTKSASSLAVLWFGRGHRVDDQDYHAHVWFRYRCWASADAPAQIPAK
jgi:hypothetical protein